MSNDLISRKEAIDILENMIFKVGKDLSKSYLLQDARERIIGLNTAFDKEKVIENLTNLANAEVDMSDDEPEFADVEDFFDEGRSQGRFEAYRNSLEIVKKGGIK